MSEALPIELPGLGLLPVLFENTRCLAVDKPADLACSAADSDDGSPDLEKLIASGIANNAAWAVGRELTSLRIVRPLEPGVGGVLLMARAPGSRLAFAQAIEERRAFSDFLAVVDGKPAKRRWSSCLKIRPDPDRPGRVLTHTRQGQFAETLFETVGYGDGMTLVAARPRTARQHQIRAHLAAAGLPILGDTFYGFGRRAIVRRPGNLPDRGMAGPAERRTRLALRAVRLAFECPFTREPIDIHAPVGEFLADYGFELEDAEATEDTEPAAT